MTDARSCRARANPAGQQARDHEAIQQADQKGFSLIPVKVYFVRGRAKLLIGVAKGKQKGDKRQAIATREHKRDMDRAMSRKR